jgi:hypothetical protein
MNNWLTVMRGRATYLNMNNQLLLCAACDDPPDAPVHHRGINANTPQPRYSRV